MDFLTLDIPPGIKSHGVDLDSIGRWIDGNLIRWQAGSARPVGGWLKWTYSSAGVTTDIKLPTASGIPRSVHAWFDTSENAYFGVATESKTFTLTGGGTIDETTIGSLTAGGGTSGENLGYGGKRYGREDYGTERSSDGILVGATVWAQDNWGEFLVAVSESDTRLLIWKLSGLMTTIAAESDVDCPTAKSLIVTQERFLMTLGANTNPRLVKWCDREDYTVWTPTATNEAGDYELPTSGTIERAMRVRGRTLIVTTTDAHVAIYQGPPIVYGFQRVGAGCGIAAPLSLVEVDGAAFWMGHRSFFVFDGSKVQEMPCEVTDKVFDDLNRTEIRTVWGQSNQRHSEIWWFYPSDGSTAIDSYVSYDYRENHWSIGKLARTAGVDLGVFTQPYMISAAGQVYRHEVGNQYDGADPYVESGPIMLGNGHQVLHATQLVVDERDPGDATVSFDTRFYPDGTEYDHGPYALTGPPTDVRFTGRQFRMRVTGKEGASFRFGVPRLRVVPGGRR